MKTPFFDTVIWAIDTLEAEIFQTNAEFIVGALSRAADVKVYPVHVLGHPYASPKAPAHLKEAYLALAEKRLMKIGEDADIRIEPGTVLTNEDGSVRKSVQSLIDFSLKREAKVIVATTHSRGPVAKLFMGSFAETLLLQSPIPVITVNPSTRSREKVSKILFPTTLDQKFFLGFQRAVELCALLGAGLTLFYKEPFIPVVEPALGLYWAYEREEAVRTQELNRWLDFAKSSRVPVEVRLDTEPGNVAESIQTYAFDHKMDLIFMVSETTNADGPRVGDICRKVVRVHIARYGR